VSAFALGAVEVSVAGLAQEQIAFVAHDSRALRGAVIAAGGTGGIAPPPWFAAHSAMQRPPTILAVGTVVEADSRGRPPRGAVRAREQGVQLGELVIVVIICRTPFVPAIGSLIARPAASSFIISVSVAPLPPVPSIAVAPPSIASLYAGAAITQRLPPVARARGMLLRVAAFA
jgi:hypothetical protein